MAYRKANPPKVTIHCNVWGNWYGYISGRRVKEFYNTSDRTQQQNAVQWKIDTMAELSEKFHHDRKDKDNHASATD